MIIHYFDSLPSSCCSRLLTKSCQGFESPRHSWKVSLRQSRSHHPGPAAMATVCRGPATKVVTQPSHSCAQSSSSSSRGQRIALLPSCHLSALRTGGSKATRARRGDAMVVRMGIRAVESFDATFQLTPDSDQLLRSMLTSESFNKQTYCRWLETAPWTSSSSLNSPERFSSPCLGARRRNTACFRRNGWPRRRMVRGALNRSGSPPDPQGASSSSSPSASSGGGLGSTRLGRLIAVRLGELQQRWNTVRRHFPAKIFLLLLGFFFANALATILGQTGDWDVIAAGILVAIIEGIGQVMYNSRLLPAFLGKRGKDVVEMVNFWKIGFTFALFVDAFKVGS